MLCSCPNTFASTPQLSTQEAWPRPSFQATSRPITAHLCSYSLRETDFGVNRTWIQTLSWKHPMALTLLTLFVLNPLFNKTQGPSKTEAGWNWLSVLTEFCFQKELIFFCVTAPTKGSLLHTTDNTVRSATKVCLTDSYYSLVHSHLLAKHSQSNEQLTLRPKTGHPAIQ